MPDHSISQNPLRVLLVDDSAVVRGMLRSIIEKDDGLEIIATASNGLLGVQEYKKSKPDAVLMDIEMPEMNGIDALTAILAFDPDAKVIMCSSLTQSGAEMTVKALNIGAADCMAKPSSTSVDRSEEFADQLIRKLLAFPERKNRDSDSNQAVPARPSAAPLSDTLQKDFTLKPYPPSLAVSKPQVIAIGSSTGGPKALSHVLMHLEKTIDLPPILVTQHMPAGFTKMLAETIHKDCNIDCVEAADDMLVKPKTVYIAPGGKHLIVEKRTSGIFTALTNDPPVNFCKPAVDIMFDSILEVYRTNILSVILTGMGNDGFAGAQKITDADPKNLLIAQDKETSVVWGMPAAVAEAGICNSVLPLGLIPNAVNNLLKGQKP